jgi:isoleucyl-tRNA synthetase
VASVDFREDMAASENLMQRCAELYRKLRNTFRFLLGNLAGFNPATDAVNESDLLPLDRYMLARTRELAQNILTWYEEFEFHRVYQAVNEFAVVDLSAFYLDALKDRMYTFAPTSLARRSAQTVLWRITEALARLVAPIMSFTADEVWEYLPAVEGREKSVHLALFKKPEEIFSEDPAPLLESWGRLFAARDKVFKAIEDERKLGKIGKGLAAKAILIASASDAQFFRSFTEATLAEFFNVSSVVIGTQEGNLDALHEQITDPELGSALVAGENAPLLAFASPAAGTKCNRCWRYREDTADYGIWHDVCTRCQGALEEMGIAPPEAEAAQ